MKHFTIARVAVAVLAAGVVCLSQAAVASAGGGNSYVAKLCQKDGWQTLVRADTSSFASQDDCVSYGAQGGIPGHPTQALTDCTSLGGTFAFGTGSTLWTCNGWPNNAITYGLAIPLFSGDCVADGGQPSVVTSDGTANFKCSKVS